MSIAEQAKAIQDAMNGWLVAPTQGQAFVVSDLQHLWKLLFNKSSGLKVLIMYAGEEIRQVFEGAAILGRVDRRWIVVVSRGRGLYVERGISLTDDNQGGEPLFNLVEQARDIVRALMLNPASTERPIDYTRIIQFPTEGTGMIIDAYQIEFTIGTQLQMVKSTPDNPAPAV